MSTLSGYRRAARVAQAREVERLSRQAMKVAGCICYPKITVKKGLSNVVIAHDSDCPMVAPEADPFVRIDLGGMGEVS